MAMPSTHASANTASRWRAKTMLSPSLLATNCHSGRVSRSMRCASSSHSIASSGGMPKQRNSTTLSTAIRASLSASGRSPTWSPSSQTSGKLAGGSGSPKRSSSSRLAFRISWGSGAGTLTPSDSIALLPVAAREVGTERGQAYRHVLGTLVGRRRVPRSEEHTSELQSRVDLVCRLLLEKKNEYMWSTCYLSQIYKTCYE